MTLQTYRADRSKIPTQRISLADLERLMKDPKTPDAELKQYFTSIPAASRPFSPSIIVDPARVEVVAPEEGNESLAMDLANSLVRTRRQSQFKFRRATGDRRPVLVAEGDSWFHFPVFLDDVILDLNQNYNVWTVAAAGDTLQNMVVDKPEYLEALDSNASNVRAFLFSGGGNDMVGDDDSGQSIITQIIKPFEPGKPAAWFLETGGMTNKLAFVEDCYRKVLEAVDGNFPGLPVICHGYDYAIPGGQPGDPRRPAWAKQDQWMGRALRDDLGITEPELQSEISRLIIDRLNERIIGLCGGNNNGGAFRNAWHVDVRGTIDQLSLWADELHPTTVGFARVAAKFETVISKATVQSPQEAVAETTTPHGDDDAHVDASERASAFRPSGLEGVDNWRVAKALGQMRRQLNTRFPSRRTKEDGTIGDARHASKASDHNPWVKLGGQGIVTAMDITHDPASGCTGDWLAETIRSGRDTRIKYIIWNRRICSSSVIGQTAAWAWRPYDGDNPHNKHIHISVKSAEAVFDSEAPWALDVREAPVAEATVDDVRKAETMVQAGPIGSVSIEVPLRIVVSLGQPVVK